CRIAIPMRITSEDVPINEPRTLVVQVTPLESPLDKKDDAATFSILFRQSKLNDYFTFTPHRGPWAPKPNGPQVDYFLLDIVRSSTDKVSDPVLYSDVAFSINSKENVNRAQLGEEGFIDRFDNKGIRLSFPLLRGEKQIKWQVTIKGVTKEG